MKYLALTLVLSFIYAVLPFTVAQAFDPNREACNRDPAARQSSVCDIDQNPIVGDGGILLTIVNIIAIVAGFAAVVVIIIAGFQFIFSNGDSSKISSARNALLFAVVGLVVIVMSRAIIGFVIGRL